MKTIGILGGMSWESTATYYRRLNELVRAECGGVSSARIILHSFNFAEIEKLQHEERWDDLADLLGNGGAALRAAGAEILLIATNTMHLLAERIESMAGIPLLHIADGVARTISENGYETVALLGTRFTMEKGFYAKRIRERSGAESLVPDDAEREIVHQIIYTELCSGAFREESRARVVAIIDDLASSGAQAAVLGCTELPLLVKDGDASIPVLDTAELHVREAVRQALE